MTWQRLLVKGESLANVNNRPSHLATLLASVFHLGRSEPWGSVRRRRLLVSLLWEKPLTSLYQRCVGQCLLCVLLGQLRPRLRCLGVPLLLNCDFCASNLRSTEWKRFCSRQRMITCVKCISLDVEFLGMVTEVWEIGSLSDRVSPPWRW